MLSSTLTTLRLLVALAATAAFISGCGNSADSDPAQDPPPSSEESEQPGEQGSTPPPGTTAPPGDDRNLPGDDPQDPQDQPEETLTALQAYEQLGELWSDNVWPPKERVLTTRCSKALQGSRSTIDVGPGKTHEELTTVPWMSLQAGDVVNIFHRDQPYRTKFMLRAQGTAIAPVVINGVTNSSCERPEISGENAVTATDSGFISQTESLGTIFMYRGNNDDYGYRPTHIVLQNLKITGANERNIFIASDGSPQPYEFGSAGIYAIVAENITINNCEITDNGNGIFFNTRNEDEISENIGIRNNLIYGNGNAGRYFEHNLYVQVRRALYEGNKIGQLVPGAAGSSLKDRSSGTVIRYNHIDAAARAIDLVEIEGGYITDDPLYPHAWVYGNLITTILGRPSHASTLLIHWGGDNDPRYFRDGTLNFAHNTVLVEATQEQSWYVSLLDLETETERVDVRNNVFVRRGTTELRMTYQIGNIDLNDTNWITSNWQTGDGTVNIGAQATVLTGTNAGLNAQFVPLPGSAVIDSAAATPIHAEPSMASQNLQLQFEYSAVNGMAPRTQTGSAPDLGAFEAR